MEKEIDPVPAPVPAAPGAVALLDARRVLSAAADPVRLALLREFARGGTPQSVIELAARVGRSADLVAKHLGVLREARMIVPIKPPGSDQRRLYHEIPSPFLTRDAAGCAALDFGAVLLRLP